MDSRDVEVERIISRIVNSFSQEQYAAWELGQISVGPVIGTPKLDIRTEWVEHDGQSWVKIHNMCSIDAARGNGKTYYVASLYVMWCIQHPGVWANLRELGQPIYALMEQVYLISEHFLASTPFRMEILNKTLVRGVVKK